jgi:hypothetical protein
MNRVLNDAFAELLEWDDYFALPETLAMDAKRVVALRDGVERMAVATGVILLVTQTTAGWVATETFWGSNKNKLAWVRL